MEGRNTAEVNKSCQDRELFRPVSCCLLAIEMLQTKSRREMRLV